MPISKSEYFLHRLRDVSKRAYTSLLLSRKSSFIFILVFTAVVVIDSSIVDFSSYSGVETSASGNTDFYHLLNNICSI
jgi:hypothetical protein